MQVPFTTSNVGISRTSSTASGRQDLSSTIRTNTGQSSFATAASDLDDALKSRNPRSKANTFSGFIKRLGQRSLSRPRSKTIKNKDFQLTAPLTKSLDINEEAVERVMGKPKEPGGMSEDAALQLHTLSKSKSRSLKSINDVDGTYERGRAKHITNEDIQRMFSGAPYFNAGRTRDGLVPRVVFVDAQSREFKPAMTDSTVLGHSSFETCSLALEEASKKARCVLDDSRANLREFPSMVSLHGAESGTVGFEHFLQLANAELPILRNRKLVGLNPDQIGVRDLNTDANIDRLAELGVMRHEQRELTEGSSAKIERRIAELGDHLFTTLLHLPAVLDPSEFGLKAQIEALQRVSRIPQLWHDFSLPDVRLRIGQLLWSAPNTSRRPSYEEKFLEPSDREIVLLQITLACELLVRLGVARAVCSGRERADHLFSESDRIAVEHTRGEKVNWDLVLAERFLDNIDLSARIPNKTTRNGLFSRISYLASREGPEPFYQPKDPAKQIAGLVKFAETLKWPTAGILEEDLTNKIMLVEESLPELSQRRHPEQRQLRRKPSGFTGDLEYSAANEKAQQLLGISRRGSRPNTAISEHHEMVDLCLADTLQTMQLQPRLGGTTNGGEADVGSWLSRSWLSGLVLPGDSANHFLMSALLENTTDALNDLGEVANLHGGFVYKGRSYWSKYCVVGRVMAAVEGAAECMGWISVPGTPAGLREGWAQLETRDVPLRTKAPEDVGRASNPLGRRERTSLLEIDLVHPADGPPVMGNEAQSHGLALRQSGKGLIASVAFSSPVNSKLQKLTLELTHNVHFVSAYPCFPTTNQTGPEDPSLAPPRASPAQDMSASCRAEDPRPVCHPLHRDYRYEIIPVAVLLSLPLEQETDASPSPSDPRPVIVLDCRGKSDLQLLARVRCAQIGEHAIVSRVGRTCLACSIREAFALGFSFIIRI